MPRALPVVSFSLLAELLGVARDAEVVLILRVFKVLRFYLRRSLRYNSGWFSGMSIGAGGGVKERALIDELSYQQEVQCEVQSILSVTKAEWLRSNNKVD